MWNHDDLVYMAATIDGEGSIGIEHLSPCKNRPKDYYVCRLTVVNTSLVLVEWLKAIFGGQFDIIKKIKGRKTCYRWHIFGEDLEKVLIAIKPYLKIKANQAQIVLDYRKTVGITGWNVSDEILKLRKNYWLKCKQLNQVGD